MVKVTRCFGGRTINDLMTQVESMEEYGCLYRGYLRSRERVPTSYQAKAFTSIPDKYEARFTCPQW